MILIAGTIGCKSQILRRQCRAEGAHEQGQRSAQLNGHAAPSAIAALETSFAPLYRQRPGRMDAILIGPMRRRRPAEAKIRTTTLAIRISSRCTRLQGASRDIPQLRAALAESMISRTSRTSKELWRRPVLLTHSNLGEPNHYRHPINIAPQSEQHVFTKSAALNYSNIKHIFKDPK